MSKSQRHDSEWPEDQRGNQPPARVAENLRIEQGLAEPDRLHRWSRLPLAEWHDDDARELARRVRSGRRVRVDLGQVGAGEDRVWWVAALPLAGSPVVAGYARGDAYAVMDELDRRGWVEAMASHDLLDVVGCWPDV